MAMSKAKRSLVNMLVLLVLGSAAIYFGVIRTKEESDKHDKELDAKEKVFDFAKDAVKRVSLKAKGANMVIDKEADGWRITAPVVTHADKSAVDAIVDKLAGLKAKNIKEKVKDADPQYVVADGAAKLKDYGLESPKFVVTLGLNDGKEITLSVGDESSLDQSLFFTKGDNKVYLAETGLRYPLDKGLFDLRDKSIVTHEDKDVQELTVSGNGVAWSVARDGDGWKLTLPIQDKADKGTVDGVLAKIRTSKAKAFPYEDSKLSPEELAKLGFDHPTAEVIFALGTDKAKKTLQVTSIEDGGVKKGYARLVEGGPVAEVDASLGKDLLKSVNDLRDKTLAAFDREKLTKLEVIPAEGEKLTFTRTKQKGADGGEEMHLALEGHSEALKNDKVTQSFSAVSNLKAMAIADETAADAAKYGLDNPQFTLVGYDASGEAIRLVVGGTTGTRYYVQKGGNPHVYEVERNTLDNIPRKVEDALATPPATTASTGAPGATGGN